MELPRRRLGRLGLVVATGPAWLCLQAWAGVEDAPPDLPQWLARLQRAAATRSFQGTVTYSVGGAMSSARMEHHVDAKGLYERLEVLDGRARLQYRHNDLTVTVWPGKKLAMVEPRDPVPVFPALSEAPGLRPQEHYELRRVSSDRVAGRDADVLLVDPRDKERFAQRWWVDRESGLMLRSDTLSPQGEVLESAAFTDLKLLVRAQSEPIAAAMKRLDRLRVLRSQPEQVSLESQGWSLRPVAGFHLLSCGRRLLDPASEGQTAQVLQAVYSDGLSHVSVFIEPYDATRHRQGMRTMQGATHTVMHRRGEWWITVVGEVPMPTVMQFDAALERRR